MNHKTVISHFFLYASTALFYRGINLFLMPLYMHFLSPSQYGMLSLIEGFVYIVTTFIGVGLRKLLALEYVHHTPHNQKKITNHIIIIYMGIAVPLLICLYAGKQVIIHSLFSDALSGYTFAWMLIIIFCSFFCELLYQIMRFEHQAKALSVIHLMHALCIASITLSTYYFFNPSFVIIPAAQSIAMILVVLIGLHAWFKARYHDHIDIQQTRAVSRYYMVKSVPLIVATLLQWLLESSDRWVIARVGSLHDVGIYSTAYLFNGLFYSLVVLPWTGAYVPYILQKFALNKETISFFEYRNRRFMWITMISCMCVTLIGMTIAKKCIYMLLPTTYHTAFYLIGPMIFGRIIYFGAQFNLCLLQFYKKTDLIFISLLIPALLNPLLNYIYIPRYGLNATVVISILTFSLYFLVTWYFNYTLLRKTIMRDMHPVKK